MEFRARILMEYELGNFKWWNWPKKKKKDRNLNVNTNSLPSHNITNNVKKMTIIKFTLEFKIVIHKVDMYQFTKVLTLVNY